MIYFKPSDLRPAFKWAANNGLIGEPFFKIWYEYLKANN